MNPSMYKAIQDKPKSPIYALSQIYKIPNNLPMYKILQTEMKISNSCLKLKNYNSQIIPTKCKTNHYKSLQFHLTMSIPNKQSIFQINPTQYNIIGHFKFFQSQVQFKHNLM